MCKSTTPLITDCRVLVDTPLIADCRVLVDTTEKTKVDVVIEYLIKRKAQLVKETQEITATISTLTKQKAHSENEDIGLVRKESRWN